MFTNLDDYKKFSKSDVDIKQELQQFFLNPERYYMSETVGLFLHAILVSFGVKGTIYQVNSSGEISPLEVGLLNSDQNECFFAWTEILHVDPVVDIKTEPNAEQASDIVLCCPHCFKTCGGLAGIC